MQLMRNNKSVELYRGLMIDLDRFFFILFIKSTRENVDEFQIFILN